MADLAVCAVTSLFVFQFCLAVQNKSMIISAPHTPQPHSGSAGGELGDASALLGARGGPPGLQHIEASLRAGSVYAKRPQGCHVRLQNRGEASVINVVPLGSRCAAMSHAAAAAGWEQEPLSRRQTPPAPRAAAAWGPGRCLSVISPIRAPYPGATASSPPSGTLAII